MSKEIKETLDAMRGAGSAELEQLRAKLEEFPLGEVVQAGLELYESTYWAGCMHHIVCMCQRRGAAAWPALAKAAKLDWEGVSFLVMTIAECKGVSAEERLEAMRDLAASPHKDVIYEVLECIDEPRQVFGRWRE